jgi:hypothetical protein
MILHNPFSEDCISWAPHEAHKPFAATHFFVYCGGGGGGTQLREDVTVAVRTGRYVYGDEQHLEEALNRIFKFGRSTGIPRRYFFTLPSPLLPLSLWAVGIRRGPGIWEDHQTADC